MRALQVCTRHSPSALLMLVLMLVLHTMGFGKLALQQLRHRYMTPPVQDMMSQRPVQHRWTQMWCRTLPVQHRTLPVQHRTLQVQMWCRTLEMHKLKQVTPQSSPQRKKLERKPLHTQGSHCSCYVPWSKGPRTQSSLAWKPQPSWCYRGCRWTSIPDGVVTWAVR